MTATLLAEWELEIFQPLEIKRRRIVSTLNRVVNWHYSLM